MNKQMIIPFTKIRPNDIRPNDFINIKTQIFGDVLSHIIAASYYVKYVK